MPHTPTVPSGAALERKLFTLALLLGTWIPMAFFLAVGAFGEPDGTVHATKMVLLFLGAIHVPATMVLYVDRRFRRLVRESPVRYVYVPLAVIAASGIVFTLVGGFVQAAAFVLFAAWQAFHYGRQNVGVYAFAAVAHGWRARAAEKRALELATACAVCGTVKVLGADRIAGDLLGFVDVLFRVGYVGFVGVVVFGVYHAVKERHDFSWSKTVFFFTLLLFFTPLFLSSSIEGAFFSYAIAHGVQYLAFVTVVSVSLGTSDGRAGVRAGMLAMAMVVVVVGVVGNLAADVRSLAWVKESALVMRSIDVLFGLNLGVTIAHFVVDAGAWRLSRPSPRDYVTGRFAFLFGGSGARQEVQAHRVEDVRALPEVAVAGAVDQPEPRAGDAVGERA